MKVRAKDGIGIWNCEWLSRRQIIQRAAAAASFSGVAESFADAQTGTGNVEHLPRRLDASQQ